MISPKLSSLNSILADKTTSDQAPPRPAPKPKKPAPEANYQIALLAAETLHAWLAEGKLYALIAGLNQPELAEQIRQRHPEVETALYQGSFGAQHTTETPRFSQMDVALYDWLQPTIEHNPGWGWALLSVPESYGWNTVVGNNTEQCEMPLTRSFKEMVQARAARDPEFRRGLYQEAVDAFLDNDIATGKVLLRDYVNTTVGFQHLGEVLQKSPKSIMRMLDTQGNPRADNLFAVLAYLKSQAGMTFRLTPEARS